MNSVWTGEPSVIYGNVRNNGCITSLPRDCAAEVPCLVDASGIQPTYIGDLPPQLTALIRTNINVQELTVRALMSENRDHIYHAAMMDPHTAAELDLDQIWSLVDDLLAAHGDWLPAWARVGRKERGRLNAPASLRLVGVRFFLVVASGDDVGALEPAVEVDVLAARRAERIGLACRLLAAFGAGAFRPQRRDLVVQAHGRAPASQPPCTLKPSPLKSATVS